MFEIWLLETKRFPHSALWFDCLVRSDAGRRGGRLGGAVEVADLRQRRAVRAEVRRGIRKVSAAVRHRRLGAAGADRNADEV